METTTSPPAQRDTKVVGTLSPLEKPLAWVYVKEGRPFIRWRNISWYVVAVVLVQLASVLAMAWWLKMPVRYGPMLLLLCPMVGSLVVVVELQRQYVLSGRWRLRLGLGALLLCTTMICLFAGILGNIVRSTEALSRESEILKQRLEEVIGEGRVSRGTLEGRSFSCQVTRKTFSDSDLQQVVLLTSRDSDHPSELTGLLISGTQVTDAGVQKLRTCKRLTMLEIPSLTLSEDGISALCECTQLQFLFLDESLLTAAQRERLQAALPKVKLNGVPWK